MAKRIEVISPNGLTVVEIGEDQLPRYESLGYKRQKPAKKPKPIETVNEEVN